MARETFSAHFEVQSSDEKRGTFSGIASVPGSLVEPQPPANIATFIMPGAFKETLRRNLNKIKIYREHEELIGKMLDAYEGRDGLHITGKISETSGGKDTLALMRDGAPDELSIAFKALDVEFLSGSNLVERLAKLNLDREIAARIRESVEVFGESERYRLVKQLQLYHVGVVEEGADTMTQVTEVNKKIANGRVHFALKADLGGAEKMAEKVAQDLVDACVASKMKLLVAEGRDPNDPQTKAIAIAHCKKEDQAMMTMDDVDAYAADLIQQAAACMVASENESDEQKWIKRAQARYLCSAAMTLMDMPVIPTEQMSKAPTAEKLKAARNEIEQYVGRMLSAKNISEIRACLDESDSALTRLRKLLETATGTQEEGDSKQSSTGATTGDPQETRSYDPASLIERKRKIRDEQIKLALQSLEMINERHSNSTGDVYSPL